MTNKRKYQDLVVGTVVVASLSVSPSISFSVDDGFTLKEAHAMERCYWLTRKLPGEGLCGERMRPDVSVLVREANKGNNIAAMRLGQLYRSGTWGVELNLAKAIHWYTRAAELGDQYSQLLLAHAYELGSMGAEKDLKQALKFYKMATENGLYPDLEEHISELEETLVHQNDN